MPQHKKPRALRELHGTAHRNKHRDVPNQPEPSRGIGPPSPYLTTEQQAIWDEVVGEMYRGVLGSADRIALEAICRLVHRMRFTPDAFTAAHQTQLTSLLGRFGMTPSDRTKITIPKGKNANPFGDF